MTIKNLKSRCVAMHSVLDVFDHEGDDLGGHYGELRGFVNDVQDFLCDLETVDKELRYSERVSEEIVIKQLSGLTGLSFEVLQEKVNSSAFKNNLEFLEYVDALVYVPCSI